MIICCILAIIGICCMMVGAIGYFSSAKSSYGWVIIFITGLVLTTIGYFGGIAIKDYESEVAYQCEYNYCPNCGYELPKGE